MTRDLELIKRAPVLTLDDDDNLGALFDFKDSFYTLPTYGGSSRWYETTTMVDSFTGAALRLENITTTDNHAIAMSLGHNTDQGAAIDGTRFTRLQIRLRRVQAGPNRAWRGWLFWANLTSWDGNSYPFTASTNRHLYWDQPTWPGDDWTVVTFDLSGYSSWVGETITHLRFDLSTNGIASTPDIYEIDWVRVDSGVATAAEVAARADALELGAGSDIAADPVDAFRYRETATLETAVRLSLFTDARAGEADELPSGAAGFGADRRGWWGSAFLADSSDFGSKLWTLKRSALTAQTRQRARGYALEALAWLVELGIAEEIRVAPPEVVGRDRLELRVDIERGGEVPARFSFLWGAL